MPIKSTKAYMSTRHHTSRTRPTLPAKARPRVVRSSAAEQLQQLKPTPELLAYYKEKVIRYHKENEVMLEKVDECKALCDQSFRIEQELQSRNAEVSNLQQAVSDLQVYLYQEREQVLRLYAENDKLKIRELSDRKKIDLLLSLSGTTETELTFFMSTPQASLTVPQRLPARLQHLRERSSTLNVGADKRKGADRQRGPANQDAPPADSELLSLQIQSLSAQLEEQTRLFRDQMDSLLKDRDLVQKEREAERGRLQQQVSWLGSRVKEAEDRLCSTTKQLVAAEQRHREGELAWLAGRGRGGEEEGEEGEEEIRPQASGYSLSGGGARPRPSQRDSACSVALKAELRQRDSLVAVYQEQCATMEAETAQLRAQTEAARCRFRERTQRLAGQVTYLKTKFDELDRRRVLEAEGFRNEVKLLRDRLRGLEQTMAKVGRSTSAKVGRSTSAKVGRSTSATSLGSSGSVNQDTCAASKVTLEKARQLEIELRNIKHKVLNIEQDLQDSCWHEEK